MNALRTRHLRRSLLAMAVLAGLSPTWPAVAQQGAWPTAKPITLVVPYPAGGATDILARTYSEKLQARLGQTVIVDNRAGANTLVASKYVMQQPGDGYTLYLAPSAFSQAPVVQPKEFNYDIKKDFTAISQLAIAPMVLVVNANLPVKNVADLVALAKSKPGQLNFASVGMGATDHLGGELFAIKTGIKMNFVPYKGAVPAQQDLVAGIVDVRIDLIPTSKPYIESGKLRGLAITGSRTTMMPDLPALSETVPGVFVETMFGLYAPKGVPKAIVDRLNKETEAVLAQPDVVTRLRGLGLEPKPSSPEAWLNLAVKDAESWAKVVKDANIKVE